MCEMHPVVAGRFFGLHVLVFGHKGGSAAQLEVIGNQIRQNVPPFFFFLLHHLCNVKLFNNVKVAPAALQQSSLLSSLYVVAEMTVCKRMTESGVLYFYRSSSLHDKGSVADSSSSLITAFP